MKLRFSLLSVLLGAFIAAACGSSPGNTESTDDTNTEDTEDGGGDTADSDTADSDTGDIGNGSYIVKVDGVAVPVTRMGTYQIPVNYAMFDFANKDMKVEIIAEESITEYVLSPKSREIDSAVSDNIVTFTVSKPDYLMLQIPDREPLFILIDPKEEDAPELGDANVKNIMDYEGLDNTGETDMSDLIQAAVDEASGATKNILFFPKGIYGAKLINLKSDMTLYLARGAVLQNLTTRNELLFNPNKEAEAGRAAVENCGKALIIMNRVKNAKLMGRGALNGNGSVLNTDPDTKRKMFQVKIENSTDCEVEGILSLDSPFWNTLIYRSENINIRNYKVINHRIIGQSWNETDGVDFDNCTDSKLSNAFLYTGDDCMAVKSDDIVDDTFNGVKDPTIGEAYIAVDNIVHENIVCFSGSSGCKIGTKTFGDTMRNISFKDVDIITANRALVIDAVDTASIEGSVFEDIRIEDAFGSLVDFNMDPDAVFWRKVAGTCSVKGVTVKDVTAEVTAGCRIKGYTNDDGDHFIDGVDFVNFTIEGNLVESLEDASCDTNSYATDITFSP